MERQIKNAADAGEGDPELHALRARLAAGPKDLDARVLLARVYKQRGYTDLALEHYRLAAAQFPDSAVVHLELAGTLREMGVPAEALRVVREFVAAQPSNWEAVSLEGVLEDQQGDLPQAEKSLRAALALAPDRSSLHNNLGYNLLKQGRTADAVPEFRRALELDPKSEIAHNNLGAALAAVPGAAPQDALAEFNRSGKAADAHNNLAAVLIEQHRYAEARDEISAALRAQPGMPAALANLKLVSEFDGKPALVSVSKTRAASARKHQSLWAGLFHKKSAAKPADRAGAPAASPVAPPDSQSTDSAVKK